MGAMENKTSFNSKLVLVMKTATDAELERIESVISMNISTIGPVIASPAEIGFSSR